MDNKQQVAAVAVLGVVLLAVVIYLYVFPSLFPGTDDGGASTTAAALDITQLAESDVDVTKLLDNLQKVNFNYREMNADRDPMKPRPTTIRGGAEGGGGGGVGGGGGPSPGDLNLEALQMVVTGIMGNNLGRTASVNIFQRDYVVFPGYQFDMEVNKESFLVGIFVTRITHDEVVLTIPEYDDEEIPIRLKQPSE